LGLSTPARGQLPEAEERLKILTDPESLKKKMEKEQTRPPREIFLSQVAPFDVLPFVKPHHWITLTLEMRSNYEDFSGSLQTLPVPLVGLPQEVVYRRDARLVRAQRARLSQQVMLPAIPRNKEVGVELVRPDAVRADLVWPASVRGMEPRQMLVVFLTKGTPDAYAGWGRFQATIPDATDRGDPQALERDRYYRLVLPLQPDRPPLSPHPLTWTTISHVVWDGMAPDTLNPSQQQALLDWLHWGGQLIVVGGAGPSFSLLNDSFLAPYLPGEAVGNHALLGKAELQPLSEAFPPPIPPMSEGSGPTSVAFAVEFNRNGGSRYLRPVSINPAPARPVYLAGLKPKAGASAIPLGDSGERLIGAEWRVGRGRVTMLALNPTDPALASWPGLDTFVRRVVLRRREEPRFATPVRREGGQVHRFGDLSAPDLSWVRYLTRDLGGVVGTSDPPEKTPKGPGFGASRANASADDPPVDSEEFDKGPPPSSVAEWRDDSALSTLSARRLEEASGIKVPSASFVLRVVLAYILALVPLNWLVCRYLVGRRELAWVVVPVLSVGFAVVVERAAAYDLGFDNACDEIDVVEAYGDYPRALVTRYTSLYSTGRTRFTVSYPDNPTALALPLRSGQSIRGEDVSTTVWQSYPVPALAGLLVQPRSLAMVRAEEMLALDGNISLQTEGGSRRVINGSSLPLNDAVLVDLAGPSERKETYLGTIAPGASVAVKPAAGGAAAGGPAAVFRPSALLKMLREHFEDRPENRGEIRLVAWTPEPLPGQKIEPAPDRHRGLTAVVIHLRNGPPPDPSGPYTNALANPREPRPEADHPVPADRDPLTEPAFEGEGSAPGRGGMSAAPRARLQRPNRRR
jgi:hypothetical protein